MTITYTPLSLEDLCINILLQNFWKDNFQDIREIYAITDLSHYFLNRFQKRHSILKCCKI